MKPIISSIAPALAMASMLALSACATPETRVRTALQDAGLSRPMSKCMAQRMVDQLSLLQLRRLESLSGLRDSRIGDMTFDQFFHHVRALKDPEIISVVSRAGLGCAISG